MDKKPKKKRMTDISRTVRVKKARRTISPKVDKEIEKKLEEIDRQVEKFEKEEGKRFKAEEIKEVKKKGNHFKKLIVFVSLVVLAAVLIYLGIVVLPRADIKIVTKKSEWNFIDSIITDKSVTEFSTTSRQIPAEVFSLTKNFNFLFPATGKKNVERKAIGKITIYNAFSSNPQILVATTRFMAPDGKIFRLDNRITVPGATIAGGKITPSKIEAAVSADKPGPDYNIGPISHFSIPGFQDSDKYQGFYGESQDSMKGGFIGEQAFPTENDIKQAKEEVRKDLKDYIDSLLISQVPEDFKIIDGARQFIIKNEEIKKEVDEGGNFTVFLEGKSSIITFKESSLLNLMVVLAKSDLGNDFSLSSGKLEYGVGRADFRAGKISFAINFDGVFERPVDIENFRKRALSKSESDLKNLISSYDNIEKATISFWPFWVKSVPKNPAKVKVEVQ